MKFFSLCLFILSSFFVIADDIPVPEQDMQYLQQDEDENGYGCIEWDTVGQGRSIQQSDGTWVDQHPERFCEEYCRPPRSGDEEVVVFCHGSAVRSGEELGGGFRNFSCTGVSNKESTEKAEADARAICNYQGRRICSEIQHCNIKISCDPGQVCVEVDYENGRYYID